MLQKFVGTVHGSQTIIIRPVLVSPWVRLGYVWGVHSLIEVSLSSYHRKTLESVLECKPESFPESGQVFERKTEWTSSSAEVPTPLLHLSPGMFRDSFLRAVRMREPLLSHHDIAAGTHCHIHCTGAVQAVSMRLGVHHSVREVE